VDWRGAEPSKQTLFSERNLERRIVSFTFKWKKEIDP